MLLFLETVNVLGILLIIFMLAVILRQQPSRAQTAFVLYSVFTAVFIVGIQLELIHSDTIGEALSGLCVQYVGQAGLLMSLLWFVSKFIGFYIPIWVYSLEAVCSTFVILGVFTAQKHRLFYTSMRILTDGMYNRIEVEGGVLWYLHFLHLYLIVFTVLFLCAVKYKGSAAIQKKRIAFTVAGIGAIAVLLMLKIAGLFGSYNPIVIAMTFSMFCMMIAMVRYSYFDSLHAAVDNAFNHGNEGLIILDSEDTILFANHRIKELFPDICEGGRIGRYREVRALLDDEERLLRRGEAVYELRAEDIIEHGEKNGCMLWFVDQTQGLLTLQKLREADEAKTQFLMRVSHELRTPMNTMLGMNEMILRESGEEEIRGYAKEVAGAGAHMISLIDEVLDVSRLESGTITILKNPYQISGVIRQVEELMRPQAQEKGLAFIVEVQARLMEKNCFQSGDAAHILQVLVNLVSNAIKYTDKGSVWLKACTREENGSSRLVLSVIDTGIGICKEEITQIFENFGRGSNTEGKDGMGLGLAIVKQLVESMEGTIVARSEPGKGSTFTVSLNGEEIPEKELAAWQNKEQKKRESEKQGKEKKIPDFHEKSILVVDDNEHNRMVIKHLLKRTKAVVETVADGKTAAEVCMYKKYDLILLDHMMPEMDGVATLRQIRKQKSGKNWDTRIIALTANAGKGARQMYLSEGFADYVTKPVVPEKLEQVLCHFLITEAETELPEQTDRKKEAAAESGWFGTLEKHGIQTRQGLRYADMDAAFYRELLTLFVRKKNENRENLYQILRDLVKQENTSLWKMWVASCHGLKGEAKGLGAENLSEYFYQLEYAGRAEDREKIEEILPVAEEEWEKVINGIQIAEKEAF